MTFSDEKFAFQFEVIPSGVYFEVSNESESAAYIDWGHCFFVVPDGNTFNALNTDILEESNEVSSRSVHRTQLPPACTVKRFTTATVGTTEQTKVSVREVGYQLSETRVTYAEDGDWAWSPTAISRTSLAYARGLTMSSRDSWGSKDYWPAECERVAFDNIGVLREEITPLVETGTSFGLGVRIVQDGSPIDYRFDFDLDVVYVSTFRESRARRSPTLRYTAHRSDNWEWKEVD